MSTDPPPLFAKTMHLRWGEMDAMRHLNNVAYFRYFEEARIAWFYSLGTGAAEEADGPVLGRITCKFLVPAVYPCAVTVELRAGRIGNASFDLLHVMRDAADPSRRYAEGEATLVWIDTASGKSRPLPDVIRARLQG